MDASQKEEACCLARLMMAVTAEGNVTAMVKEGSGSLDPSSVSDMMQVTQKLMHIHFLHSVWRHTVQNVEYLVHTPF